MNYKRKCTILSIAVIVLALSTAFQCISLVNKQKHIDELLKNTYSIIGTEIIETIQPNLAEMLKDENSDIDDTLFESWKSVYRYNKIFKEMNALNTNFKLNLNSLEDYLWSVMCSEEAPNIRNNHHKNIIEAISTVKFFDNTEGFYKKDKSYYSTPNNYFYKSHKQIDEILIFTQMK